MEIAADDEFRQICSDLVAEGRSLDQWAESPAGDYFQTDRYCGGYEIGDQAFWFSYYASDGTEWWFSVTLEDAHRVARGERVALHLELPKK